MKHHTFHLLYCLVFFGFFSISVASAASYQKIAPGDTVTLGEFVFDDDFVATTTACTVGITSPLNVEVVPSTTPMTANTDGWHYYNYTTAENAPSGVWPSVMICGSVARGDLVMVDKSFIVDWSVVSTSTIKTVVDESLTVATSSLAAVIGASTEAAIATASSSLFATLPATIWSFSSRTLTSFGTLVADTASAVWTSVSRTLTGAGLDSGSLATLSDVQTATSSLASAITAGTGAVNSNTDAQLLAASTSLAAFITANSNATILAASTSLASYLSAYTDAASSSIASFVNANTNSTVLAASTSLAAFINANTNTQTANIASAINLVTESASSSLAASIQTASSSVVSQILSSITSIPANVWGYSTRSLTTFGTLVADVWTNTTRTLTGAGLDSGSLATLSDIQTATSSLASVLTAQIQSGSTVTLSDFGETTVNTAYKAKLQVLNYATIPTDADSLPTVVVTDPVGTVQVPAGTMTKDSNGTYSYSYSIGGSAVGGVWETGVSVVINGETVKVNDYWSLSSSPADVQIIEITDKVIPFITANVRIDNMGTAASDFYYVYCIVSSADNLCGGNDDVDSASDTAYISAGSFINLELTLDEMTTAGTYWFKVKARALAETNWAASTEQFVAESGTVTPPPPPPPAGGGGGGGGAPAAVIIPTTPEASYSSADFNRDGKVNSVDFSILLAFWQKQPLFKNPYVDINKDNKVNSVDFSILLYQWKK